MSLVPVTMAVWDYDRVQPIINGQVRAEGIDLNVLPLRVEEIFFRALRSAEFDVCELSLSSYVLTLREENPPFIAIPVFPSRFFRHQSIYVNVDKVREPQDLIGARVGVPEFQMTASVWQRGILAEHHGVPVESVEYVTGALTGTRRRREKIALDLPPTIRVSSIAPGQNLSRMLAEGEIDALYTAHEPDGFGTDPRVGRLFRDFVAVEKDYFAETGIFPIMHVMVIKRDVHRRQPWIAQSLVKAFAESLEVSYQALREVSALKVTLPWLQSHVEDTLASLGEGYWDYGLEKNRSVLETFLRYSHDQGLAARRYSPEDLFVEGTEESFVI